MMRKFFMILCLSFMFLSGLISSADAYPVNAGFLFDGLDLDTGTVQYDRTILVVLMGETIEEILRPATDSLTDFRPAVDLSFDFNPAQGDVIDLVLLDSVKVSVLKDTSLDMVDDDMLKSLKFTGELSSIPITISDLVVARTTQNRYFLLSEFQRSGWYVEVNVDEVTSRIIPEPSTLVLLGLGLLLTIRVLKRKTHLGMLLLILLLLSFGWAEQVQAQTDQRITVKKEGAGTGTILIGEQECGPDCSEMIVPYVDHQALVLKVIPDEDSYFVRWKQADGSSSKGAVHIEPGETVIVVFNKKWVPFDPANPVETPTPPEIQVPVSTLQDVVVDVTFPGMHVGLLEEEGEAYQHLTIPDAGHLQKVGEPQLPMLGRFIALPAGANVSVEVLESSVQELEEYMISPAQEPLPDLEDASPPPFTKAETVYQQDAFYPSKLVELEGPSIIRGASVVILRMFPVQFNPVQRKVRVYSHLRVKVAFENGDEYFIDDRIRSSSFDGILGNLLLNADTALSTDTDPDAASDDGNSLLIITHPDFLDAAMTLAEWKIRKGIPTEVRTTTQTGNTATAIQQFIQNAYDNWTIPPTYVLLIGDAEFIPCHYETDHPYNSDWTCNNCQGDIGTDLYYAAVDGTDYLPDLSIGRLSVDTLDQAHNRVNAIINYEQNPPIDNNFYTHATVAAYFQDRNLDGFADRRFALTSEDIRDHLVASTYTVDRIYFTESTVTPTNWSSSYWPGTGAAIPTALQKPTFTWNGDRNDITSAVNNGRFLVTHRDHGASWGWGDPEYTTGDVQALDNGDELPVVWSVNCQTGWFDNETDNPNPNNTSTNAIHFSEAWERNMNGGAIGIIAATRVSYSGHNDRLVWGWMDAIWPNFESTYSPSTTPFDVPMWEMGPVLNYGKYYYATHYGDSTYRRIEFEMFHWFGDPTMQIWTGIPQTLNVSHPTILPAGNTFVDVNVNQSDALICISRNEEILGKALSKNGTATVPLSRPLSEEDVIYIVVTKHNFRPYEGTLNVVSSNILDENETGDLFGKAVVYGDFNKDGYMDLVVGAPGESPDGDPQSGSVFVFKGDKEGMYPWMELDQQGLDVNEAEDQFGTTLATGDFNKDGYADLAVGALKEAPGGSSQSGAVFIFKGSQNGLQSWMKFDQQGLDSNEAGDNFSAALATGDFNKDGYMDLAVGAPGENSRSGYVFVFEGSSQGLRAWGKFGQSLWTNEVDDRFGSALASGDFNKDGFADLAIGAPGESPFDYPKSGFVFVFKGSTQGLEPWAGIGQDLWTNEDGDEFGTALASGDFNKDGYADLAVGAPGESPFNYPKSGFVFVFKGSQQGLEAWKGLGQENLDAYKVDDRFGAALAVGDFNNDNVDDLAVGAPGKNSNAGCAFVFRGSSTDLYPWTRLDQNLGASEAGDKFGAALAAGDFNGDGFADLAIGTPEEAPWDEPRSGVVFVFTGTANEMQAWNVTHQEMIGPR